MPEHDPVTFDIETSTYVLDSRSIAINGPNVSVQQSGAGDRPGFKPLTLTKNLILIDSFEQSNTFDDLTESGWSAVDDTLRYTFDVTTNISAYNCLSLWAKAAETSSVRITAYVMDSVYNTSMRFDGEILDADWKRYDFEISVGTTSCDLTSIDSLIFEINGDALASLWMDEIYLLDLRTNSNRSSWIPLNISDANEKIETPFTDAGSPGLFGSVNYIGKPGNQEIEMRFVTNATYQDDEISFIDTAKKSSNPLYLRAGRDGFSGYVTGINNKMVDTYIGLQRRGTLYMTQEL